MTHILQQILAGVNGNSIISLDTVTTPSLTGGKSNPHKGHIRKVTIGNNVMIFTNTNSNGYNNMVKRRLIGEGKDPESFKLSPRKWGVRIPDTPFITYENELYLEVIIIKTGKVHYELGTRPINPVDIIGLKPVVAAEQGGLDDKVTIRTIKCDSIRQITCNKQTHVF